jgi:hypothetical protein
MTNKETITKLKNDIQHFQQQYEKAITALIDSAREIETLRNILCALLPISCPPNCVGDYLNFR